MGGGGGGLERGKLPRVQDKTSTPNSVATKAGGRQSMIMLLQYKGQQFLPVMSSTPTPSLEKRKQIVSGQDMVIYIKEIQSTW